MSSRDGGAAAATCGTFRSATGATATFGAAGVGAETPTRSFDSTETSARTRASTAGAASFAGDGARACPADCRSSAIRSSVNRLTGSAAGDSICFCAMNRDSSASVLCVKTSVTSTSTPKWSCRPIIRFIAWSEFPPISKNDAFTSTVSTCSVSFHSRTSSDWMCAARLSRSAPTSSPVSGALSDAGNALASNVGCE